MVKDEVPHISKVCFRGGGDGLWFLYKPPRKDRRTGEQSPENAGLRRPNFSTSAIRSNSDET